MTKKKLKYYFDKQGKRLSTKEGLRRERISKSKLKSNKRLKDETLKRNNARVAKRPTRKSSQRTKRVPSLSFTVGRKRSKVKTFPSKHNKKNFFYAEKRNYQLDTPIIINNETEARNIKDYIGDLKEAMYDDLKKIKHVKNRLINVGYDISLTFQSKDKKKSKTVNIDKTCYTPSVVIASRTDFGNAMSLLQNEIAERFVKYFSKTGFGGEIGIHGFETEISSKGIF